jgi:hypothetical protein
MREFSKISPSVWRSARFTSLPSDDARYLYLYLLSCEHQSSAGAYRLPEGYASVDLNWTTERYSVALASLVAADLVVHDASASVVMIRRWFKHNPPMSESHLTGIERVIERLESADIADAVTLDLHETWNEITEAKSKEAERKQSAKGKASVFPERLNTAYMNGRGQRQ